VMGPSGVVLSMRLCGLMWVDICMFPLIIAKIESQGQVLSVFSGNVSVGGCGCLCFLFDRI
jgi:hypothetical protein